MSKFDLSRIVGAGGVSESDTELREIFLDKIRENPENFYPPLPEDEADALQVSATKLANLNAIKNGLKDTQLVVWWQTGTMPEAAALEAARMDAEEQEHLRLWLLGHYEKPTLANVRKFRVIWDGCRHECPEADGAFCPNAEAIYQEDYWDGVWSGAGCCAQCLSRDTCEACCDYVERKEPEQEAQEDLDSRIDRVQAEAETATADWQAQREAFGARLRKAREETGLDRAAFAEKLGLYKATYSAWENGSLPGSGQFPDLAKGLGVSTDYLYGLTDDPTPPAAAQPQPEGQLTIAGWMPGICSPSEPGEFAVLVDLGADGYYRAFMAWDGADWEMLPSRQKPELPIGWWLRLPPEPEKGEKTS